MKPTKKEIILIGTIFFLILMGSILFDRIHTRIIKLEMFKIEYQIENK